MITIGTVIRNKICPTMIGKVKKLYRLEGTALIDITDKHLGTTEMAICLEHWEELKENE